MDFPKSLGSFCQSGVSRLISSKDKEMKLQLNVLFFFLLLSIMQVGIAGITGQVTLIYTTILLAVVRQLNCQNWATVAQ